MIDWIKFFTLGFFSDKLTSQAPRRKYYSPLLALIIAFVLFVAVLIAADFIPFSLHYGNADDFKNMTYSAFAGETKIQLKVEDGKLTAEKNGAFINDKIINSFSDADDKKYSVNGYNLVVDTRPMTSYNDFDIEFGGDITSEEYGKMTLSARQSCTIKIILTDRVRELDDAFIEQCTDYLERASNLTDPYYEKSIAEKYEEIKKSQSDVAEKNKQIYALYLQAYYPQTFNEKSGVPILRNYYAEKYIENEDVKNYLFVFEDMLVGSFTANGVSRMFYGYTNKLADGLVITADNFDEAAKQVDGFIDSAYRQSLGISSYLYFINARRIFLFVIIIWLVLALLSFVIARFTKFELPKKFGAWFKISGSFILISSFITVLIAFICSFFVSVGTIFSMITPLFAGIMFVRLAVYVALAIVRTNRKSSEQQSDEQVFDGLTDESEIKSD